MIAVGDVASYEDGASQRGDAATAAMQVRSFWRRGRPKSQGGGVNALVRIGGERAKAALDDAARNGDRQLKPLALAARL